MRAVRSASIVLIVLSACAAACAPDRVADHGEVYYAWDGRRVLCGVGIDDAIGIDVENLREGLARARDRREVLILYGHGTGEGEETSLEKLEGLLAAAVELGVEFVTFEELALGPREPRGAVAITFDDSSVAAWHRTRDLFDRYGARVTFFVTRFDRLSAARVDQLRELRDDGHAIESHGLRHVDAPVYVEEHGLRAYLDDELLPSLEAMRDAGFAPTSFAYPYGARTGELDDAILDHVALVRSLSWLHLPPPVQSPCP